MLFLQQIVIGYFFKEIFPCNIYKLGFEQFDYGYASAVSFLLLTFTVILTICHLTLKKRIARY